MTTLSFALKNKFVLEIRMRGKFNGFFIIEQIKKKP